MDIENKPTIDPTIDGPYIVKGIKNLTNKNGLVETKDTIALCRCGGSSNKPFCDGTHKKIGFKSEKLEDRVEEKIENYTGSKITIHDNRGICAHAGYCTDGLASVFHLKEEPWIHPESAEVIDIINTIKKCPSGALSYTVDDVKHTNQEGDPAIDIAPNGPYQVSGKPELMNSSTELGSDEHFTLCRCGGSKNKPFCDGSHWYNNFSDDKN